MSGRYLSLDALGDVVRTKTGVAVDPQALAVAPLTVSELGIDSLGWLGVITEVENRFGVTLDASAESISTLTELVVAVNGAVAAGAGAPGHTDNRVVINAPLDLVWTMTNDVASWPELFSEYAEATILERDGDTVRFRLTTRPDESGQTYSWVSERTADRDALEVKARRVETGIFEFMHITWTYREVEGGVEMRWVQAFAMKPDAPADLDQATEYINRQSAVQMARIRSLVEAAAPEKVA
jgi:aromatase